MLQYMILRKRRTVRTEKTRGWVTMFVYVLERVGARARGLAENSMDAKPCQGIRARRVMPANNTQRY